MNCIMGKIYYVVQPLYNVIKGIGVPSTSLLFIWDGTSHNQPPDIARCKFEGIRANIWRPQDQSFAPAIVYIHLSRGKKHRTS